MNEREIKLHFQKVKDKLDTVSPSFCLAKWTQVTLHLQNGTNHSCHHPGTHKINIEEIDKDPSALHNTSYKKELRKQMKEGQRPGECEYCWKIEDSETEQYSDRIVKSGLPWSQPHYDTIKNNSWQTNFNPTYLEVSFSNVCNFKCSYCQPVISSQWMEEIEKHGPYPVPIHQDLNYLRAKNLYPIPHKDYNPYVDAFWKWMPDLYPNLHTLRVTGGEPLLSKDTDKLLDYVIENPNPNLNLAINTNLNPPDEILHRFINKVSKIINEKKVNELIIYTSNEAHGNCAEYIRYGLNYQKWIDNLKLCFEQLPKVSIGIMSTYNILSLTSYTEFLQDILAIRSQYQLDSQNIYKNRLLLDIPYLRNPNFLSVTSLEEQQKEFIKKHLEFMRTNSRSTSLFGFNDYEIIKLDRIYTMIRNQKIENIPGSRQVRKNFVTYIDEYDRRRNTSFMETFPELAPMYYKWQAL